MCSSPREVWSSERGEREWRGLCSEAVPVLREYLVAAKLVEVAAAVVQLLAVDAGTGHHLHRDSAVAGDEGVDVVPAHVGDDAEPIAEHLPGSRLAVHSPPFGLRPSCHQERAVVCEERHDPVNIAAIEGLVDLFHERRCWTSRHRVSPGTGTITCVRERTCGANWYQPRMAR